MPLALFRSPFNRCAQALTRVALFGLVALAGTAGGQVAGTPEMFLAQGMDGGSAAPRTGTRGVFVATLAALIAQGLGQGVGAALSQGLGGSITRWFGAEPDAASTVRPATFSGGLPDPLGSMAPAGAMDPMRAASLHGSAPPAPGDALAPTLQAGVAFEVHLISRDDTVRPVDPARHVFRTGDQFQVHYRPNLPGRVQVFNVNPLGDETRIDSIEVAAGQLASLGPYRFVGAHGEETLKLHLQPCSSPRLAAATRSIVKVSTGPAAAGTDAALPALRVGECGGANPRSLSRTRSISKATMDGATAFALDPLSADEVRGGNIAARELRISLQHRP